MEKNKKNNFPKLFKVLLPLLAAAVLAVCLFGRKDTVPEEDLYSEEEITEFFAEAALTPEYAGGGTPDSLSTVRKWTAPVRYCLYGGVRGTDAELIEAFFAEVGNTALGFPGALRTESREEADLLIGFFPRTDFAAEMEKHIRGESAYGFTVCELDGESGAIRSAVIGFNSGMPEEDRKTVILEELCHSLGLTNDSRLRKDSVLYSESAGAGALSDMDLCLLKLLYLPEMRCGMQAPDCGKLIEAHYKDVKDLCRRPAG